MAPRLLHESFPVPATLPPALIVRTAAAIVVAVLLIPAVPDVDLWGHTLFGRDIVVSGGIPARDHYSFTSDVAWVNHEWLSEVAMYGAYAAGGGAGLWGLRLLLVSALLFIIWQTLRRDGVPAGAAATALMVVALVTYPRTQHVRPQLFSLVAFAALLAVLTRYDRKPNPATLLPVPVLMLVWANLHGGFVVALLPLGLWAIRIVTASSPTRARLLALGAVGGGLAATLVNPYGADLWAFLGRTVGLERADITEWWSMADAGPGFLAMWTVTMAIAVLGVTVHARPRPWHPIALLAVLALASFRVARLDAFFAIATAICFGPSVLRCRDAAQVPAFQPRPAIASLLLVAAISTASFVLLRAVPARDGCVDRASWLPEPAASAFVAQNRLRGRIVVFFDWGEYVLWQFGPDLKVSTDGRRETVYSARHIQGHLEIYRGSVAGLTYLQELNPDYVWLPATSPAINKLRSAGWTMLYSGERSTILSRSSSAASGPASVRPAPPNCFPGRLAGSSPLGSGLWKQI